jgi:hypothetical protein
MAYRRPPIVAALCLAALSAAPARAPKDKPPTLAELRELVDLLQRRVESLEDEVAKLRAERVKNQPPGKVDAAKRIDDAMTKGFAVVGMAEAQVQLLIKRVRVKGGGGGFLSSREFLRGNETISQTEYTVEPPGSLGQKVLVENGMVIAIN